MTCKQVRFLGKTYLPGSFSKYSLSRNFSYTDLDSACWSLGTLSVYDKVRSVCIWAWEANQFKGCADDGLGD